MFCDIPQSWNMGQILLLPLRRKAYWGFLRPKNPTSSAGFEPANLGARGHYVSLTWSDINECIGDSYENVSENQLWSVVCSVVRCNFTPSTSWMYIIKGTKHFKIIPQRGNEGGYSYSMKLFLRRGRLQPKGFPWNLIFEDFSKNLSRKCKFH